MEDLFPQASAGLETCFIRKFRKFSIRKVHFWMTQRSPKPFVSDFSSGTQVSAAPILFIFFWTISVIKMVFICFWRKFTCLAHYILYKVKTPVATSKKVYTWLGVSRRTNRNINQVISAIFECKNAYCISIWTKSAYLCSVHSPIPQKTLVCMLDMSRRG